MFMISAGAARKMIVIITGKRLMMKVMRKMTDIIIINLAAVAALFFLKVSAICICSMHYPSSVYILRPVLG